MPFIGHLPELLIVLVLALLVFGPKRMIEMGASLGKSLGELRRSLKDVPGLENFTSLGGLLKNDDSEPRRTPFSAASQFAQNLTIESKDEAEAVPAPAAAMVVDAAPPAIPVEVPPAAPAAPATAELPHAVGAAAPPAPNMPTEAPHVAPAPAEPGAE
ncbi:MAG TPA: twin-arginine translocase TatA/TatE family subunit [Ktedonobacterales bacterium]